MCAYSLDHITPKELEIKYQFSLYILYFLLYIFLDCNASSLIQYNLPLFTSHFVKEQ
jgi:hypothetical protein